MALDAKKQAGIVATQVQAKFVSEFNTAMSDRLERTAVEMAETDFETGESSFTGKYLLSGKDTRIESISYVSIGDEKDSDPNPSPSSSSNEMWESILPLVKNKDGKGVPRDIDQGMMLAIAESTMIATRESMKLATELNIQYILDNLEVDISILALANKFNFIAPAIPAAPVPLIPIGALETLDKNSLTKGGIGGIK